MISRSKAPASKRGARRASPLTVGKLMDAAERRLEKADVEFPDASVLWLMALILDELEDPDRLEGRRSERLDAEQARRFEALVARREKHEPFQYIVGATDFRDRFMEIEHGVFVPREETERMCAELETWALEREPPPDGWRIAELGTGCGGMAISLAAGPLRPRLVVAVDIAEKALRLVSRNARRHGVAEVVQPLASDWLTAIRRQPLLDIVCAVPPYLNPGDEVWLSEESVLWEPMESFFGEPSGDEVLRMIVDESAARLRPGGMLALQADSDQIPRLVEYVNDDPDHPLTIEWILVDEEGGEDAVLAVKPSAP